MEHWHYLVMCMLLFQIRETRKAVHDSESGTRKMAIGHHIGMLLQLRRTCKTDDLYQIWLSAPQASDLM